MKEAYLQIKKAYLKNVMILQASAEMVDWHNVILISISIAAFILVFAGMSIVDNDGSILTALPLITIGIGWIWSFAIANH